MHQKKSKQNQTIKCRKQETGNKPKEAVFKNPKGKRKANYFEVVEDVADECDKADPLRERALPHLLTVLELLLKPV